MLNRSIETRLAIILIILIATATMHAQPWMEAPYFNSNKLQSKENYLNFYDVQAAFNSYSETHSSVIDGQWKRFPGYKVFKRWEWYMEPRVFPSGDISLPTRMMQKYYEEEEQKQNQKIAGGLNSNQSINGNWTALGPSVANFDGYWGGIGRVSAIRFNPTNSSIVWACSPLGGLWKSTNGGTNWTLWNTDLNAQIGCTDVAIDPSNSNIMYIATGDADGSVSSLSMTSQGILKSINGGVTWLPTSLSFSNSAYVVVYKILINPNNPQIILAATNQGIYRTTDGFTNPANTTLTTSGTTYCFTDMEYNPQNPNIVYATSRLTNYNPNGTLFKSYNNGITWTQLTNGLPPSVNIRRCAIAVTPQDTSKVYLVASNSAEQFYGFYLSRNSGASFIQRSATPDILGNGTLGQSWYNLSIAVCPTDTQKVICGGMKLYKSTNGGVNWTLNGSDNNFGAPFVHTDHHDIQFIPGNSNAYISANDGGIAKTMNNGLTWTSITTGLQNSQMFRLGVSSRNPNNILVGMQDNGNHWYINGSWYMFQINTGDAMDCNFQGPRDTIAYLTSTSGQILSVYVPGMSNGYIVTNTGTGVNEMGPFVTPHVMHPTKDSVSIVGKTQVYRSTTLPHSWSQVGNVTGGANYITAMAFAPSAPNYIYVVKSDRVFRSTDGVNFTNVTNNLPIGSAALTSIAVSNVDSNLVYVGFSGYSPGNKVWYSTNGGNNWLPYSNGLPNLPVSSLTFHKNSSSGLYAGTDAGVYFRSDSLNAWQPFKNNMPNVDISDMKISYSINKIRAATNGRGLWESDLALPTANFNASTLSACVGVPINLTDASTGGATEWYWTFPGANNTSSVIQNPTVVYSTPGTYTITLHAGNANGTTFKSVVVTIGSGSVATISSSGSTNFCAGGNVTLTANAASSYLWSNGATTQSILVSSSGTYSVQVTDANGCVGNSSNTVVTVNPLPTPNITASGSTNFCLGDNVTLNSSAASSYLWSNGATTQNILVSSSGTYSVQVTDANGCVGNSSNTVVTVNPLPTPNITASGSTTFCLGDNVTLNSSAASSYLWSNGATTQNILVSSSGTYSVQVTDINNCIGNSGIISVNVNTPQDNQAVTISNDTLFSPYTGNVYWYMIGNSSPVDSGLSMVCNTPGQYYSVGFDINGCSATSDTINSNCTISIKEVLPNELISIFPNPTSGELNIHFVGLNSDNIEIKIYTEIGQLMFAKIIPVNNYQDPIKVNLENLSNGVYMVMVTIDTHKKIFKLIRR